ncbi:MAG: SH3 domain-containing protein [Pseudomonadota bacterium]
MYRTRRFALAGMITVLMALSGPAAPALAQGETALGPVTNLKLPRFVSLRSSEINVRRGPGLNYPKDWVFRRAGLPVKVVEEYGDWRRIVDSDDAGGWVYHALLTGRRTVLITAPQVLLRKRPTQTAEATVELRQGVVARLTACEQDWCEMTIEDFRGWAPKDALWGIENDE